MPREKKTRTSTHSTDKLSKKVTAPKKSENAVENTVVKKAPSTTSSSQPLEEDVSQLADLRKALESVEDKYLRLVAEFENYRKRQQREQQKFLQFASASLIEALLPVLDDMERAVDSTASEQVSQERLKEGLSLVLQKFRRTLQEQGVEEIQVTVGGDFDPELHEAVTQAAAPSPELRGKILSVIEKGYRLRDRILRYTKVQTATHE